MQVLQVAMIVPDGIIRRGIVSLLKQSNYATCDLFEFENYDDYSQTARNLHLLCFDISSLKIGDVEIQMRNILSIQSDVK